MHKNLARMLAGAVAGVAATAVMSLAMWGARKAHALGEPPPRRLVRRLLAPLGPARPTGPALDVAAWLAHLSFGGAMGSLFALLPQRAKSRGGGMLFGFGVWAVNYAGILPRVGLHPPVRQDRPGRPSSMIAAHLVYGAALAAAYRRLGAENIVLRDKVVVVCGGSRGLGRALAGELTKAGARVAICGRSPEALEQARIWLETRGGPVLADVCDLRDDAQTTAFLRRVSRELGPVDVMIANAATIDVGPLETLTPADFDAAMSEIFGSAVRPTLRVLPTMRARGDGSLVFITSIGGRLAVPHLAPYSAAKFAEVGFAEAVASEVAKDGIRVLTVQPGLMRTGSHLHATFRGQAERELLWFGTSATAPLVSIDAERAAQRIVRAIASGDRYLLLTPTARVGAWLHDRAPNLWAVLASTLARLLPEAPANVADSASREGAHVLDTTSSALLRFLAKRSAPAAAKYGQ